MIKIIIISCILVLTSSGESLFFKTKSNVLNRFDSFIKSHSESLDNEFLSFLTEQKLCLSESKDFEGLNSCRENSMQFMKKRRIRTYSR